MEGVHLDIGIEAGIVAQLSGLDGLDIWLQLGPLGPVLHSNKVGNRDRGKDADNCDNDHELYEGESLLVEHFGVSVQMCIRTAQQTGYSSRWGLLDT